VLPLLIFDWRAFHWHGDFFTFTLIVKGHGYADRLRAFFVFFSPLFPPSPNTGFFKALARRSFFFAVLRLSMDLPTSPPFRAVFH